MTHFYFSTLYEQETSSMSKALSLKGGKAKFNSFQDLPVHFLRKQQ